MPHSESGGGDETLDATDATDAPSSGERDGGDAPMPRQIGRFKVEGRLGSGGMGDVFAAFDPHLSRPLAVKRIRTGDGEASAAARARFWREARALAQVHHPGVVSVHDIGEEPDGSLFIAMQRVDGHPLSERLSEKPWAWSEVAPLAVALAEILAAVHDAGLTHRDLKPANLLITADDTPVLVDFGLAVTAERDAITHAGAVIGTLTYMAPEQLEGRGDIGPAADVFAYGILLYRLLTGRHPFARSGRAETALAVAAASCPRLRELAPAVPEAVEALVAACLARDPAARLPDGRALVARLEEVLGRPRVASALPQRSGAPLSGEITAAPSVARPASVEDRPPRRRRAWGLAAAIALAGGLVAAVGLSGGPTPAPPDGPEPLEAEAPSSAPASLKPLPVRPVVVVLSPRTAPARADWAAAFADTLRTDLAQHPEELLSVPFEVLAMRAPNGGVASEWTAGDALTRQADLVVSGELVGPPDAERVALTLTDTRDGAVRWRGDVAAFAGDAVATARALEPDLLPALGLDPDATGDLPLTRSVAAYRDALTARVAGCEGDDARARRLLDAATGADPGFVRARVERLLLFAAERDWTSLVTAADGLLAEPKLSPRDRGLVEALRHRARGEAPEAVRDLYAVARRWPYHLVAREALLALLFNDVEVGDLGEAERVAREVLALAPRNNEAASRLTRALAFRGRGDAVRDTLTELHVPVGELPDIRAEVALFAGDYDTAISEYDALVAESPGQIWSIHMGIIGRILAGRCEEAAERALQRIQRVERRGGEGNTEWTYSLATQALFCQGAWEPADALLARWEARAPDAAGQIALWRVLRVVGSGAGDDAVAAALAEVPGGPASDPTLCALVAVYGGTAEALAPCAEVARARAYDLDTPATLRARWARVSKRLAAREISLGGDHGAALARIRELASPLAAVVHESDHVEWAVARLALARAAEAAGDAETARGAWKALESAGYPRLYATALWRLARTRLGAESP